MPPRMLKPRSRQALGLAARIAAPALIAASLVALPTSAQAAARVSINSSAGGNTIDPTYATTLTVRGSGFQSIPKAHGGMYVFFGTVNPGWRPTQGGVTGQDYLYVPDSETKGNQGFQKYVANPGSNTASSANGGVIAADGTWSTQIVVPGATFRTVDRNNQVRTVDCRKVTCGIITVGAHGVKNATNETFTPVRVQAASAGAQSGGTPAATAPGATKPGTTTPVAPNPGVNTPGSVPVAVAPGPAVTPQAAAPVKAVPASLDVDRASAKAGRILAFTGAGLPAGTQVSATFDDGLAAAGPLTVGADGRVSGLLEVPSDTTPGTHELRLVGLADGPAVRFAVTTPGAVAEQSIARAPLAFAIVGGVLFLGALVFSLLRLMGRRRLA